jgi:hypothetical protein
MAKDNRTYKIFVSARHALPGGKLPPTPLGECKNPDHAFVCTRATLAPGVPVHPPLLRGVRFAKDRRPGEMFYVDIARSHQQGLRPVQCEIPLILRGRRVVCPFLVGFEVLTPVERAAEATEDRHYLLHQNVDQARAAYTLGYPTHGKDSVVVVADIRDPIGGALARSHYGDEEYHRLLERYRERRLVPTAVVAMPRALARQILGDKSANAETVLAADAPDGYFRVLIIAGGGFLWGAIETGAGGIPADE